MHGKYMCFCVFYKAKTMQSHFFLFFFQTFVKHLAILFYCRKVQVGKDQEKAQSEKDSHSKNRGGKKPN